MSRRVHSAVENSTSSMLAEAAAGFAHAAPREPSWARTGRRPRPREQGLVGSIIGGLVAQLFGAGGIFERNLLGSLVFSTIVQMLFGERVSWSTRARGMPSQNRVGHSHTKGASLLAGAGRKAAEEGQQSLSTGSLSGDRPLRPSAFT